MVFDVDRLKEDIDLLSDSLDTPRLTPSQILAVGSLLKTGRLVVAGQPLWWCEEHAATSRSPRSECWVAFDPDERDEGTCRMVEGWWMPTGGNE